jgi:small subunit ribosomal protein S24e
VTKVLEVIHPNRASVPKKELAELLAKTFKATPDTVVTFGFQIAFGGGKVSRANQSP